MNERALELHRTSSTANSITVHLLADVAEVAVPEDGKTVDEEHAVVDWDKGEVDHLNKWPNHPITLQCAIVGSSELLAWAYSLKNGHGAQEDEQVGWGKDKLVDSNTCADLELLVLEANLGLEELEPRSRSRSKYCCRSIRKVLHCSSRC